MLRDCLQCLLPYGDDPNETENGPFCSEDCEGDYLDDLTDMEGDECSQSFDW